MSGQSTPILPPDVGVMRGVFSLWQQELFVDFTIQADDVLFKVHKVIVASVSEYFKVMLTGHMMESQTDKVHLKGFRPLVVSNIIQYIYTGQFGEMRACTEELLSCAVYLQIPAAIDTCSDLLMDAINKHNCFSILSTFKTFSLKQGIERTMNYIKANTGDIFSACESDQMSYTVFLDQMDFRGMSEWENFLSVEQWIQVDIKRRKKHLNLLMSHIRFALMTPDELAAVKKTTTFTKSRGSWRDLVHAALRYHKLPIHQKVVYDSNQNSVRNDPSPVCFPADDYSSCEFYTVHKGTSWTKHVTPPTPKFHDEPAAVLDVNDFLIICSAFNREQRWHLFDPRTSVWSTMAGMVRKRGHFALVHCGKHLYAIGGCLGLKGSESVTDSMERYNFETNSWHAIPSKLPVALFKHSACVISGTVFVTGGWETIGDDQCKELYNGKPCSPRLDCFKPSTKTWVRKLPIPFPTQLTTVHVMNLFGEDVLLVIGFQFRMQYFTPSTNQWSQLDEWLNDWDDGVRILSRGSYVYTLHTSREPADLDNRNSDFDNESVGQYNDYRVGYLGYDRWSSASEMYHYSDSGRSQSPEPSDLDDPEEGSPVPSDLDSRGERSPEPSDIEGMEEGSPEPSDIESRKEGSPKSSDVESRKEASPESLDLEGRSPEFSNFESSEVGRPGSISPTAPSDADDNDSEDCNDASDKPSQADIGTENSCEENPHSPQSDVKTSDSKCHDAKKEEGAESDCVRSPLHSGSYPHGETSSDPTLPESPKTTDPKSPPDGLDSGPHSGSDSEGDSDKAKSCSPQFSSEPAKSPQSDDAKFSPGPAKSPQSDDAKFSLGPGKSPQSDDAKFSPGPAKSPQSEDAKFSPGPAKSPQSDDAKFSPGPAKSPQSEDAKFSPGPAKSPQSDAAIVSDTEGLTDHSGKSDKSDSDNEDKESNLNEDPESPRPESVDSDSSRLLSLAQIKRLMRPKSSPVKPERPKPVHPSEWNGSAKWTVEKGGKFTECKLDDFPVCQAKWGDPERQYFCALLSFPPQTAKSD